MIRDHIISNLFTGKNFNDCISKMKPDHLQEDLKMEVIGVVCEWPEDKILKLHDDGVLDFYVAKVILNQIRSSSSPFAKKYRRVHEQFVEPKGINQAFDSHHLEERLIKESLEDIAIQEIDKLYWYDAELIRLYLKLGNFRAIEAETGIPFTSCYKNIQKSLSILKSKALGAKPEAFFSKSEISFIKNNKNGKI